MEQSTRPLVHSGNEGVPVRGGDASRLGAEVPVERLPPEPDVVLLAAIGLVPEQDVLQLPGWTRVKQKVSGR
jgi:hypothetical protein